MMQVNDFVALQQVFRETGKMPSALVSKYEILPRPVLLSARCGVPLRIQVFRWLRDVLVGFGVIKPGEFGTAWSPKLKHVPVEPKAKVVLFWAVGAYDKQDLRLALASQLERFKLQGGGLGVLVTNVPDFAFYSRLGWLVEYLPELSGTHESYAHERLRYLAWRYRGANVVPCTLK